MSDTKLKPLTLEQFHSVWTNAVGMDGYDKKMFQNLLSKMKRRMLIYDEANEANKEQNQALNKHIVSNNEVSVCEHGLSKQNRFCVYCENWYKCNIPD